MAHFLWLRGLNKQEYVEASEIESFLSKNKNWYKRGIKQLVEIGFRWFKIMAPAMYAWRLLF